MLSILLLGGCGTPVGVRRIGPDRVFREVTANALNQKVLSRETVHVLSRNGLLDLFEARPEEAIKELHDIMLQEQSRDALFALAELSFLLGWEENDKAHYLASAVYAYGYLFAKPSEGALEPYDPRFRTACDLYNRSLVQFLRSSDGNVVVADGKHGLPFGVLEIRESRPGFPWGPEEFDRFLPAGDFAVRGLRGRHRHPGLGASLIAVRKPQAHTQRGKDYLPKEAKIAATAFLRITRGGLDMFRRGEISGSLELYAPFNTVEIEVAGRKVPLEADLTAPVAYGLEESRLWDFELAGFFTGRQETFSTGIRALQPYIPGKIPVLFVHGTASSPARWAEMCNELQGYRELREHFQPWLFLYTTGNPIAYSASLLRESILEVVRTLDPESTDPALSHWVVIGHSQGGILTRMLTIDSQDILWNSIMRKPLEELQLKPENEELLRRSFFFERVPHVQRVVFIATPHRGSFLVGNWLSNLVSSMVELPGDLMNMTVDVFRDNEEVLVKGVSGESPTSIKGMDPDHPFLKALNTIPIRPEVASHSIIAVEGSGPLEEGDDGVVAYSSAHIEGVESEYVVPSGHSCQGHPLTIVEVRRILLEHLLKFSAAQENGKRASRS